MDYVSTDYYIEAYDVYYDDYDYYVFDGYYYPNGYIVEYVEYVDYYPTPGFTIII